MGNMTDDQFGMIKEVTYNTPLTPSRFYPFLDSSDGQFNTRQRQGQSIFVATKRGWRGDRRVLPIGQGVVTIKTELASRQGGVLLEACHGVSASTLVSGTTYQHVHKTSITGTTGPSYTIQLGKVRNDGTVDAETYSGCTAVSFEIECPEDGILTISVTFDARAMTTATGLAVASYTANAFLFDHSQGVVQVGGAFTAPTTIVMGSAATAFGNLRSWKLAVDQSADIGRWVVGSRNQPTLGMLTPTFSGEAEYNDTALRTAYLAGTSLPVVCTHSTPEALSAGVSIFQLAIPQVFLSAPITPALGVETAVVSITGDVTWDGTNELFYNSLRTADVAL